jgi:hypothetical protein
MCGWIVRQSHDNRHTAPQTRRTHPHLAAETILKIGVLPTEPAIDSDKIALTNG